MTRQMILALAVALSAATACGSDSDSFADASPAERYEMHAKDLDDVSTFEREPADELDSIAENLCDNDAGEHLDLVKTLRAVADGPGAVFSKAAVIDSYCPDQADAFTAATEEGWRIALPGVENVLDGELNN